MGGGQARAVRRALVRGQNEGDSLARCQGKDVAMRRGGCGDDGVAEYDGVAKEEDGVVGDDVGVMLLVSMLI